MTQEEKKQWVPNIGEMYYYLLDDLGAVSCYMTDDFTDWTRIFGHNCFKTKEEAQTYFREFQFRIARAKVNNR